MPVFSFKVTHDHAPSPPVSWEFPDKDTAWEQAVHTAGEMIRDLRAKLVPGTEWRMDVADSLGNRVFSLRLTTDSYE
jgi:hypothetical protein